MYYDSQGNKITDKIVMEKGKPFFHPNCGRCGGTGAFSYVRNGNTVKGGCFRCNGTGKLHKVIWHGTTIAADPAGAWEVLDPKYIRAYTKKEYEKLDRARSKRNTTIEKKRQLQTECNFYIYWAKRMESVSKNYVYKKKQLKIKLEDLKSKFVGSVGERLNFDLTFQFKTTLWREKCYPFTDVQLYTFKDIEGNTLTYVGSSFPSPVDDKEWRTNGGWEKGDLLTIKGTVKEHKTYKDIKQTQLQRLKLINY